jgi:hypothetical protein
MGHNSTSKLLQAAVFAAGALLAFDGIAEAGSVTFLSPRDVMMRHSSGPVRGQVKSMSTDEVVMILRTGLEKSYPMSGVTSIIAADKSFQFMPNQESFDEFLGKATNIRGVTVVRDDAAGGAANPGDTKSIGTVSDGYARAIGMQQAGTPQAGSSSGGFVQADGFAGSSQRPQKLARLDAPNIPELDRATVTQMEEVRKAKELEAATPKFALPGGGVIPIQPTPSKGGFALPEAGEEVLICSNPNCQKEVPGAKYGQKCPHCGIIWSRTSAGDALAGAPLNGTSTPVVDPKNPFNRPAAPPQTAPIALPNVAAATPVSPVAVQPQGFTLETIPWWGKILGFGASIMVLMWVMGRR